MGDIGDPISTTVPDPGDLGPDYAEDISEILEEVVTRLTQPVPIGSLTNDTLETLDLNNGPLANAQYVALYEQAEEPDGAPFGRVVYFGGNFYFVTSSGTIQVTDGTNLNASGIGGIVGDYGGGNPAKVTFVDAGEVYKFYDNEAAGEWAIIQARQLDLTDEATGRTVSVKPSTSVAASWTLSLPVNDPASGTSVVGITNAGAMVYAEDGAVNQYSVNASGLKHTDLVEWAPFSDYDWVNVSGTMGDETDPNAFGGTGDGSIEFSGSTATSQTVDVWLKAPPVGRRLKSVAVRMFQTGTGTNTCTVAISKSEDTSLSAIGVNGTSTATSAWTTVTATATETVTAAKVFKVRITFSTTGTITAAQIASIGIGYDYV